MDYTKIHNTIIERAKTRILEGYVEKHHIVPKCIGGTDDNDNIVELTAKEHFIVHKLLTKIYPNEVGLQRAAWLMAKMNNANGRLYRVGAREYKRLKENLKVTKEQRNKISESMKGNKNCLGNRLTNEHKSNISKSLKGNVIGCFKGKRLSKEHRKKISNSMKGKERSISHRINSGRIILQYDINDILIKEHKTIKMAADALGLNTSNISANLKGITKHCGGYIWKYK